MPGESMAASELTPSRDSPERRLLDLPRRFSSPRLLDRACGASAKPPKPPKATSELASLVRFLSFSLRCLPDLESDLEGLSEFRAFVSPVLAPFLVPSEPLASPPANVPELAG